MNIDFGIINHKTADYIENPGDFCQLQNLLEEHTPGLEILTTTSLSMAGRAPKTISLCACMQRNCMSPTEGFKSGDVVRCIIIFLT